MTHEAKWMLTVEGVERSAVRLVARCGGGRQMAGRRWRAVVTARSGSPAGARASAEWRPPLCEPPRVFLVRAVRGRPVPCCRDLLCVCVLQWCFL